MKRLLSFALLLALGGCAPGGLQLPETTTPALQGVGFQRAATILTDSERVRDIAAGSQVYVATDRGLLVHGPEGSAGATRLTTAEGLPSNNVLAVGVSEAGVATVATDAGWVQVQGPSVSATEAAPVGRAVALHQGTDGALWACGTEGLARNTGDGWMRFGESAQCTGLFPGDQGELWVGTTRGAWKVEGNVVREHGEGRGLPAGWVRSIVPRNDGHAFALVQNTSESFIAYFDGVRWYGYTLGDFDHVAVGLVRAGGDVILVTDQWTFRIADAASGGVPLRPILRGEREQVLSYEATLTPAAEVAASEDEPSPGRRPMRLAALPGNLPSIAAPAFGIAPAEKLTGFGYLARSAGGHIYIADANRGVVQASAEGTEERWLRSKDLIADRDLQVVSDERRQTWVMTDGGVLLRMRASGSRVLVPVAPPEGRLWAIASARRGLYVVATLAEQPNVLRLYRRDGDSWATVYERTVPLSAGTLAGAPFLGVTDEQEAWVAISVTNEGVTRRRGVVVLNAENENVVQHHYNSDPETDGEGALRIPDDLTNIDLSDPSMAWFGALVGAVRVGNHQAVIFGEDRGVRGEVVSDVLIGTGNRVWMAAAEGPGYRQGQTMEFRLPAEVRAARPIALAQDSDGDVWGAGPNGLLRFDGTNWNRYAAEQGLPFHQFQDIEGDAQGQLWMLGRDGVLLLGPSETVAAEE